MCLESNGKERVCQLVHQLDQQHAITSVYFEMFTSHGSGAPGGTVAAQAAGAGGDDEAGGSDGSSTRIFVLCVTSSPTRLYHFVGGPTFQQLFADYKATGKNLTDCHCSVVNAHQNTSTFTYSYYYYYYYYGDHYYFMIYWAWSVLTHNNVTLTLS